MEQIGEADIDTDWTIDWAGRLRERLAARSIEGGELVLDLAGVQACDTAGLQLICSLHKTAALRGGRVRVAALSPAITAAASAVGLALDELTEGSASGAGPEGADGVL